MSGNKKIYLIGGMRTPFGSFGGSLAQITPVELAVYSSNALLSSLKINPDKINQVILGNVVPSSTDTLYGGRHLGLKIKAPISVPGMVINRLCGSGIEAILSAARLIKLGEADCVLAAGTENMSMVPHLTYGARFGTKYGSLKSVDMLLDALTDQYSKTPMGITAENLAEKYNISREDCDEFSLKSHQKVARAYEENYLQGEITSIPLKKKPLERDEHFRVDASLDSMKKLPPTFKENGRVTAASASGIVDGAASVLIASEDFCKKEGLDPLAEIIDGSVVGVEPTMMGIGPSPAIRSLLQKNKMELKDVNLFEINEAFAAQTLAVIKDLSLDPEKLNIWGGAVALGHPLGATGVRITLTLARQLKFLKLKTGIASACIGGGQGISIMLKSLN